MYVSIRMRKLIPCYLKGCIETSCEELKDVRKKSSVVFFYKLRIKKTRYFNLRRRTRLRLVHLLEKKIKMTTIPAKKERRNKKQKRESKIIREKVLFCYFCFLEENFSTVFLSF